MKLRNLYLVHSLIALVFALGFLLIPSTVLELYGLSATLGEKLLAQLFGVQLLFAGLVTLLARDVTETAVRNAINYSVMAAAVVGVIISVGGTLSGAMNGLGWSAVVIYGAFVIAFAYFHFFVTEET